ncbi:hypothetical protein CA831_30850, partial [Burkholderia multivorans]
ARASAGGRPTRRNANTDAIGQKRALLALRRTDAGRSRTRPCRRPFHVPRFRPRTTHDESAYSDRSRPAR